MTYDYYDAAAAKLKFRVIMWCPDEWLLLKDHPEATTQERAWAEACHKELMTMPEEKWEGWVGALSGQKLGEHEIDMRLHKLIESEKEYDEWTRKLETMYELVEKLPQLDWRSDKA